MNTKQKTHDVFQLVVPAPRWLQRQMLHSLKEESRSRVSQDRAAKAKHILDSLPLKTIRPA